jgi:hypothetical protein
MNVEDVVRMLCFGRDNALRLPPTGGLKSPWL